MRNLFGKILIAVTVLALALPAAAQEAEKAPKAAKPVSLYRVDFAVRESENGQRINSRSYTQIVEVGGERGDQPGWTRVRAGASVPIIPSAPGPNTPSSGVTYMDVGTHIDCQLRESDGYVRLNLSLEISSFAQDQETRERPLLRRIRSEVQTAVVPGKPTVVSSIDDTASKRRYELEVTATKVK